MQHGITRLADPAHLALLLVVVASARQLTLVLIYDTFELKIAVCAVSPGQKSLRHGRWPVSFGGPPLVQGIFPLAPICMQ